ncbi:hypothetical protein GCM10022215_24120 [Nocardioides fonticola]|uniref:Phage-related minor tail protein n=1 Tax=Nocardioides fonticola TaxID=450363 RepID=A0ABP7XJZ3_9ACTN
MSVRRESVFLSLEDDGWDTKMAKHAAATALLNRELDRLDGVSVQASTSVRGTSDDVDRLSTSAVRGSSTIDQYSGRLSVLLQAATAFGPAIVPVTAVAIPAITGLASQLGFAAAGVGVLVGAFQGVGDALKAVNEYGLDPTTANLEKVQAAMEQLSPPARAFVMALSDLVPELRDLRDAAAEEIFPDWTQSLTDVERLLPRVEGVVRSVAGAIGDIGANTAESLAGPEWRDFIRFTEQEARPTLLTIAGTLGSVAHGLAELWMATQPLNDDFGTWLQDSAAQFDGWASGLAQTQGFEDFVDYVRTTGPEVADTLGSIAVAGAKIVEAAAPLGGPVLKSLELVADVVGSIADSDFGTPLFAGLTAMSAFSLATRGLESALRTVPIQKGLVEPLRALRTEVPTLREFGTYAAYLGQSNKYASEQTLAARQSVRSYVSQLGPAAAVIGSVAIASSGLGDKLGLTNTAALGLAGSIAGPLGIAVGSAVGLTLDLSASVQDLQGAMAAADSALDTGRVVEMKQALAELQSQFSGVWFDDNAVRGPLRRLWATMNGDVADTEEKVRHLQEAIRDARRGDALTQLYGETTGLGRALRTAASSADQFRDSFKSLNSVLDRSGSLIAYEQALDDLAKSIKDNGSAWDVAGEKGRANISAVNQVISAAITRSNTLKDAGKGLAAQRILDRALTDLDTFLGKNKDARAAVADQIRELRRLSSEAAHPTIDADTGPFNKKTDKASRDLQELDGDHANPFVDLYTAGFDRDAERTRQKLRDLDGDTATVFIKTITTAIGDASGGLFGGRGSASGGTVPKTGLPYADRHPYLLADGEEVISNRHGQADRHRPLLKAINAGRLAEGGTVGLVPSTYASTDPAARASTRLAAALDDATSAARRELEHRKRLLDRELQRDEAEARAAKDRVQATKDEIASIADAVKSALSSQLFPSNSQGYRSLNLPMPADFSSWDPERQQQFLRQAAMAEYQANVGLGYGAKPPTPEGVLRGDILQTKQLRSLVALLKDNGLNGRALSELVQQALETGNLDALERYAADPRLTQRYERDFRERDRLAGQLGRDVGMGALGGLLSRQEAAARAANAEVRETNRRIRALERQQAELNKTAAAQLKATKGVGDDVGRVINHGLWTGVKGRAR